MAGGGKGGPQGPSTPKPSCHPLKSKRHWKVSQAPHAGGAVSQPPYQVPQEDGAFPCCPRAAGTHPSSVLLLPWGSGQQGLPRPCLCHCHSHSPVSRVALPSLGPLPCHRWLCQPRGPSCGLRGGPGQELLHRCDTGGTGDTGDTREVPRARAAVEGSQALPALPCSAPALSPVSPSPVSPSPAVTPAGPSTDSPWLSWLRGPRTTKHFVPAVLGGARVCFGLAGN